MHHGNFVWLFLSQTWVLRKFNTLFPVRHDSLIITVTKASFGKLGTSDFCHQQNSFLLLQSGGSKRSTGMKCVQMLFSQSQSYGCQRNIKATRRSVTCWVRENCIKYYFYIHTSNQYLSVSICKSCQQRTGFFETSFNCF